MWHKAVLLLWMEGMSMNKVAPLRARLVLWSLSRCGMREAHRCAVNLLAFHMHAGLTAWWHGGL